MLSRQLSAFNTATDSENKIHDDATAQRFGFTGGLVPGVEVHGYLSWGPVRAWGEQWLRGGTITSRYAKPTYDGEQITVTFDPHTGAGQVLNPAGVPVAVATAALPDEPAPPVDLSQYVEAPLPAEPPAASPQTLAEGTVLGSIEIGFPDEKAETYLRDVREVLPVYDEGAIAHPGWVLGLANTALLRNVRLGPWIHVGSSVRNHRIIARGEHVSTRGHVRAEYEKSGHRFVELDLVVLADGALAATIEHVAIYRPRQVAEAEVNSA